MPYVLFPLSILLAGCSSARDDRTAATPDEDRQLNQAAAELDASPTGNLQP